MIATKRQIQRRQIGQPISAYRKALRKLPSYTGQRNFDMARVAKQINLAASLINALPPHSRDRVKAVHLRNALVDEFNNLAAGRDLWPDHPGGRRRAKFMKRDEETSSDNIGT